MKTTLRRRLVAAALSVAAGAFGQVAFGQAAAFGQTEAGPRFPVKPITLICPWPPGGSTDIHLRKMAELGSKRLGQPGVVENRPGGSGMDGPATLSETAPGDGYTLSHFPLPAAPAADTAHA